MKTIDNVKASDVRGLLAHQQWYLKELTDQVIEAENTFREAKVTFARKRGNRKPVDELLFESASRKLQRATARFHKFATEMGL